MFLKAGVVAGILVLSASSIALAEDEPAGPTPPRYAGSEVSLTHNASIGTFAPGLDQTYNPTISQNISLDPRWRLNKKVSLSAHLGLETELTESDVTSYERQPLLEDVYLQGSYALPQLPLLINGSVGLRLTLPTSKASLARDTYFSIAPSIALNRSFQVSKNITLQPFVSFRANLIPAGEKSAQYDAPTITNCSALDNCDQVNHSGSRSSWLTMTETAGVAASFPKNLSAQVVVGLIQNILYDLEPLTWQGMEIEDPNDGPNARYIMLYVIEAGWEPMKHLKVAGGFQTINEQLAPDSSYYAPFFNRNTQVYLKGTYVF